MLVGRVESEYLSWAELLQTCLAFGTGAVCVHRAADRGQIAGLERGHSRPDLGNAQQSRVRERRDMTVGITSFHSLRTVCRSEWQMPQKRISMYTSLWVGSRRLIVKGASGEVALAAE